MLFPERGEGSGFDVIDCFTMLQPEIRLRSSLSSLHDAVKPRLLTMTLPSRPGELHPEALTDPYVNLSIHTARVTARGLPPSIDRRIPPVAG